MLSVFGDLKHLVKYKKSLINNSTFKLHYKFTFTILCIFSVIQTLRQHLGDPIICSAIDAKNFHKDLVNTYCWIHGTYIIQHPTGKFSLGQDRTDGLKRSQYWYQWVIFVLFLQAILCYLPHYIWKIWEGKKISLLIQDLHTPSLDTEGQKTRDRRRVIVNYLFKNNNTHNLYVAKFVLCEFMNLFNILGQMYFMNYFFEGTFLQYGFNVLGSESNHEIDQEMTQIFPKIAKCNIHTYGVSGTVQKHDAFCVLPMNNFNGKFYFFLWFWYLFVGAWTAIFLCFRILTITSSSVRTYIFIGRAQDNSKEDIFLIMKKICYGEWFILMQLCKNIHPEIFRDLVIDLTDKFYPVPSEDEKSYIRILNNPT